MPAETMDKEWPAGKRPNAVILALGFVLLLPGLARVWAALASVPDFEPFQNLLTGAAQTGAGLGVLGVELGWFDPAEGLWSRPGFFYGAGAAIMAGIGWGILRWGMRQIGGYDDSIVVDFGWRLYQGQRPYLDFPCPVPVAFPLGTKFAFEWFGVSWRSIIEMTALYAMATFAWTLFLMGQLFGRGLTTLLWTLATQAFSMMVASFWWYSPITAQGAVIYMLSAMLWLRRPDDNFALTSYGAALFLMATLKANDAGIMIPGFTVILLVAGPRWWKVAAVSVVAFVLFLILLSVNHFTFFGLVDAYRYISPRGASLVPFLINLTDDEQRAAILEIASLTLPVVVALSRGRPLVPRWRWTIVRWAPPFLMVAAIAAFCHDTSLKSLAAVAIVVPPLLAALAGWRNFRRPEIWLGWIALIGGIYGFLTNSEQKLIDLPPLLVAALLIAAALDESKGDQALFRMPRPWSRYFSLVCVTLGCLGLAEGYSRLRVQTVGLGRFFQFNDRKHTIETGFFAGVHCGDVLYHVLDDLADLTRREPTATIHFGTRLEWAYAAFDRPSPRGLPVVWDSDTMFDRSKEDYYFSQWLQRRDDIVALLKNDFYFASDQRRQLLADYSVDQSYRWITLLRRRK